MYNKKLILFIAVLWTLLITFLSLASLGSIGQSIKVPYKDKIVHFTFYFVFVVLWNLYRHVKEVHNIKARMVLFIAIAYGILMEIFQAKFTNYRSADVFDALINSFGAISGLLFFKLFLQKKNRKPYP